MSTEDRTLEAQIAALGEEQGKAIQDTNEKLKDLTVLAKTTEEALDAITRDLKDRRISLHGGDTILEAIPENQRGLIRLAEIVAMQHKAGVDKHPTLPVDVCAFPDDPVLKVAMATWFKGHLMKLTRPGDFHGIREQHEKLQKALNGAKEKVALQEDTASEGGNFVPTVVEAEILRLVADNSIMRPLVRKVPMTTKTHAYPTRAAAITAAIIAEEGSITDSIPATPFSQSNLTAKKLAAFATVSSELMQDNVVLLADYLATEFSEQIGRLEDQQALEGDGTGVNFTGVVAASGVNSVTSGTNGDFVSYVKLVDTIFAGQEGVSRDGAMFFWNPQVQGALYKSRASAVTAADNAGLPMFGPAAGIGPAFALTLLGYPFKSHTGILRNRTVGSGTNRTNLYFGPPRTIIFGDRLGLSVDLNPWAKFQTDQIDIRAIKRTGILVAVPAAWTKYTAIDGAGTMIA